MGNDGGQLETLEGVTRLWLRISVPLLGVTVPSLGKPGQTPDGPAMPGAQHTVQLMDGQRAPR